MTKVFLLFVLVMAMVAGCVNLPVPPLGFTMYCDICGQVTNWGVAKDYFYCGTSGTIWDPVVDMEAAP